MVIRFILYKLDDAGEPLTETRDVRVFEKDPLLVGSNKNCDLQLSSIPDLALAIHKNEAHDFVLEKKENPFSILINDTDFEDSSTILKSGDKLRFENYLLCFIVEFEKVEFHWNTGFIARVSTALIIAILIAECGIITWLPRQLHKKQMWGLEVTRQRTLGMMDALRIRGEHTAKELTDDIGRNTIKLVIKELDDIAIYVREYVNRLDALQLSEIQRDLMFYDDIVDRVEKGNLYPKDEVIDAEFYIKRIIGADK